MAFKLGTPQTVNYACSCSTSAPLTHLFFCQHCVRLRCARCVSHEIETYYCPYCLETMSAAESKSKKNRCGNCCDCPSCGTTLTLLSATIQTATDTESIANTSQGAISPSTLTSPAPNKKVYYLRCSVCRWTSRDLGMPDKDVASGGYPIQESPAAERVNYLCELYRRVGRCEKEEREHRATSRKRSLLNFTSALDPKLLAHSQTIGLHSRRSLLTQSSTGSSPSSEAVRTELAKAASTATAEIEPLPDRMFTDPVCLDAIATLPQRLGEPAFQPAVASVCQIVYEQSGLVGERRLCPQHKLVATRRLQRCKHCEHILNKPDSNPSSIKSRLQLIALHYLQIFRISKLPPLYVGQWTQVVTSFTNPLNENVTVTLQPYEAEQSDLVVQTAEIELPTSELVIAARDDTADYDDVRTNQFQDDPSVIAGRKNNKLLFFIKVRPLKAVGDVKVSFLLCFKYVSAVHKEKKPIPLRQRVDVNFGPVSSKKATTPATS